MTDSSVHNLKKSIGSLRKASLRLVLSRLATNPKHVRAELKQWLGDQASKLDCKVGLIEVFTGRARLSEEYEKQTGKASIRLGLQYGQDFTKLHDRRCLLLLIALCRPEHVWFSFPCKPWGPWTRLNMSKSDKTFKKIMSDRQSCCPSLSPQRVRSLEPAVCSRRSCPHRKSISISGLGQADFG